jgi:serine/threonine-protein kinase
LTQKPPDGIIRRLNGPEAMSAATTRIEDWVPTGEPLGGKYLLLDVLGEGGMGVVLSGQHVQLGYRVAIKLLRPESAAHPEAATRFLREGRAAAQIASEHVVRVSDVGTLPSGIHYLVMELLDGVDLAKLLAARHAPLAVEEAVGYVLQAVRGLADAHALGIVHRDLKPANLFLTRRADGSPLIKILDFGISKLMVQKPSEAALTASGVVMGSPAYMSPEQIRSAKNVDSRADIWALGMILYEMIGGRPAFEADTTPGLLAQIVADPPRPLRQWRPDVSPAVEAIIMRCLEKDPAQRPSSVLALEQALFPFTSVTYWTGHRNPNPFPSTPAVGANELGTQSAASHRTATVANWGSSADYAKRSPRGRAIAVIAGMAAGLFAALWILHDRGTEGANARRAEAAPVPPVLSADVAASSTGQNHGSAKADEQQLPPSAKEVEVAAISSPVATSSAGPSPSKTTAPRNSALFRTVPPGDEGSARINGKRSSPNPAPTARDRDLFDDIN